MDEAAREAVLEEAWRQAEELVTSGVITTKDGAKTFQPGEKGSGDYYRAIWGLLHFKPPRKKDTALPEDFILRDTTGAGA